MAFIKSLEHFRSSDCKTEWQIPFIRYNRDVFRTPSNIYNGTFGESIERLTFFAKTKSSQTFCRILSAPLIIMVNPFSTNIPLLYLLKTSENLRFSNVVRRYRSEILVENGLNISPSITVFTGNNTNSETI